MLSSTSLVGRQTAAVLGNRGYEGSQVDKDQPLWGFCHITCEVFNRQHHKPETDEVLHILFYALLLWKSNLSFQI